MLVEESAVLPVDTSDVRIMCTGPNSPPIARPVMVCFTVLVAKSIIGRVSSVKPSKRVKCQARYTVVPGKRHR